MGKKIKPKTNLEELTKKLKTIKARDIMTKEVITAKESDTLADIAEVMIKTRISGLPVVNKRGKVSGVIAANDLFLVMDMIEVGNVIDNDMKLVSHPTVKFAMSTQVLKIKLNTSLDEIIALMKYKNAHTLPVFSGNKMVGVVGRRDVFKNFYATARDSL